MLHNDLARHRSEFQRYINNHQWERTEDGLGILFPRAGAIARGVYVHSVNGQDEREDHNLLTIEGVNYLLSAGILNGTQLTAWYMALYATAISPATTWTAATWVALAGEITSGSEGYSETVRQTFTGAAPAAGSTNNTASKAAFTIVTATTLTVNGCALASASAKGATTGKLLSACRFATARALSNTDVFQLGYTTTLTPT